VQSHFAVRLGTHNHNSLNTPVNFLNQPVAPVSCDAAAEYSPAVASDVPPVTSAVPAACGSLKLHDSQMPATLEVSVKIRLKVKGKPIPLQVWTDLVGSRRLRLPNFKTIGT